MIAAPGQPSRRHLSSKDCRSCRGRDARRSSPGRLLVNPAYVRNRPEAGVSEDCNLISIKRRLDLPEAGPAATRRPGRPARSHFIAFQIARIPLPFALLYGP